MRILHVVPYLTVGGVEVHLLDLCRGLLARDHRVGVFCFLGDNRDGSVPLSSRFEAAGVTVIDAASWRANPLPVLRLRRAIRDFEPDIVHSHLPRADLAVRLLRVLGPEVPWVCSVHDIHTKSWRAKWALPWFGRVWSACDRVVAISRAVEQWLEQSYPPLSGRTEVIYYGTAITGDNGSGERTSRLAGSPRIGCLGRLEPRKGHQTAIRAMRRILEAAPDAHLAIAGHDPCGYSEILGRLIRELGLDGRVSLVGFQEDIRAFLEEVDVVVMASSSEGFGMVLIEAMAAGKPVVASRISPIDEIVRDGSTGILCPPGDPDAFAAAVVRLLEDGAEAVRMGSEGRKRVGEVFTIEKMVETTLSLYESFRSVR